MKIHHTKNKGDLGVAKAHCDLVEKGYVVLFPTTEHAPFDLVAYDGLKFVRLQVKYRKAVNGSVRIRLENWWADKNGSHSQMVDKEQVDVFCIYCPDTDTCYYFKPKDVRNHFTIRVAAPKNNQSIGINLAENFTRVP
ncbi:MAG TPA: group I intron-associated PD-(D/E)XK endonuclease [Pyrinomonadaceae bacterium]|nr:group I intron-associated PD-(D/E)XK endonuclease [Pyrinomonadaceae bacterium]